MAPQYKLTYFDIRGLAETCRYLFNYGGIEFEDHRINKTQDWPEYKDKTPFGVLPLLEHNGKVGGQSIAIARYIAKKVKLAGNNDWEDLEIDEIVDTINDLRLKLVPIFLEQDAAKKKALLETMKKESLGYYLPRLEKMVQKNKGHLVLGRLTWADFYLATMSSGFEFLAGEDVLVNYPNLQGVTKKVEALPAIKKWIAIRPKTDY